MTNEEQHRQIGAAFQERKALQDKLKCLRFRLRTVGEAAKTLADNHLHKDSRSTMESASDVREDFADMDKSLIRLAELNKLLGD